MWNGKKVSVVFSTYRDVKTIRKIINGLFDTGVVDEVIAVDNNAEKGTREEVKKTKARLNPKFHSLQPSQQRNQKRKLNLTRNRLQILN